MGDTVDSSNIGALFEAFHKVVKKIPAEVLNLTFEKMQIMLNGTQNIAKSVKACVSILDSININGFKEKLGTYDKKDPKNSKGLLAAVGSLKSFFEVYSSVIGGIIKELGNLSFFQLVKVGVLLKLGMNKILDFPKIMAEGFTRFESVSEQTLKKLNDSFNKDNNVLKCVGEGVTGLVQGFTKSIDSLVKLNNKSLIKLILLKPLIKKGLKAFGDIISGLIGSINVDSLLKGKSFMESSDSSNTYSTTENSAQEIKNDSKKWKIITAGEVLGQMTNAVVALLDTYLKITQDIVKTSLELIVFKKPIDLGFKAYRNIIYNLVESVRDCLQVIKNVAKEGREDYLFTPILNIINGVWSTIKKLYKISIFTIVGYPFIMLSLLLVRTILWGIGKISNYIGKFDFDKTAKSLSKLTKFISEILFIVGILGIAGLLVADNYKIISYGILSMGLVLFGLLGIAKLLSLKFVAKMIKTANKNVAAIGLLFMTISSTIILLAIAGRIIGENLEGICIVLLAFAGILLIIKFISWIFKNFLNVKILMNVIKCTGLIMLSLLTFALSLIALDVIIGTIDFDNIKNGMLGFFGFIIIMGILAALALFIQPVLIPFGLCILMLVSSILVFALGIYMLDKVLQNIDVDNIKENFGKLLLAIFGPLALLSPMLFAALPSMYLLAVNSILLLVSSLALLGIVNIVERIVNHFKEKDIKIFGTDFSNIIDAIFEPFGIKMAFTLGKALPSIALLVANSTLLFAGTLLLKGLVENIIDIIDLLEDPKNKDIDNKIVDRLLPLMIIYGKTIGKVVEVGKDAILKNVDFDDVEDFFDILNMSVKPVLGIIDIVEKIFNLSVPIYKNGKKIGEKAIDNQTFIEAGSIIKTLVENYSSMINNVINDFKTSFRWASKAEDIFEILDLSISPISGIVDILMKVVNGTMPEFKEEGGKLIKTDRIIKIDWETVIEDFNKNIGVMIKGYSNGIKFAIDSLKDVVGWFSKSDDVMELLDKSVTPISGIVNLVTNLAAGQIVKFDENGKPNGVFDFSKINEKDVTSKFNVCMTSFKSVLNAITGDKDINDKESLKNIKDHVTEYGKLATATEKIVTAINKVNDSKFDKFTKAITSLTDFSNSIGGKLDELVKKLCELVEQLGELKSAQNKFNYRVVTTTTQNTPQQTVIKESNTNTKKEESKNDKAIKNIENQITSVIEAINNLRQGVTVSPAMGTQWNVRQSM